MEFQDIQNKFNLLQGKWEDWICSTCEKYLWNGFPTNHVATVMTNQMYNNHDRYSLRSLFHWLWFNAATSAPARACKSKLL